MKTALVTGHLGFIGRHITAQLLVDGWEVAGYDMKTGYDCRDVFRNSDHQFDLVVHCAAVVGGRATIDREPMRVATDFAIDSDFFQFVLRTRPAHAVYFSSSAAYPIALQRDGRLGAMVESWLSLDPTREFLEQPDAIYGWVKLTGEKLAQLANAEGANIHVFRPFSGYGSDQDLDYPFPSFITRAVRGDDPFTVWGDGQQVRDWIHIDDIVRAVLASLDYTRVGPVNLCTGISTTMLDLIRMCWVRAGRNITDLVVNPVLDAPVGVRHRVGDPALMTSLFGLPTVPLTEGVDRAIRLATLRHE